MKKETLRHIVNAVALVATVAMIVAMLLMYARLKQDAEPVNIELVQPQIPIV